MLDTGGNLFILRCLGGGELHKCDLSFNLSFVLCAVVCWSHNLLHCYHLFQIKHRSALGVGFCVGPAQLI